MTLLIERATEDDLADVIAVDAAHMGAADLDSLRAGYLEKAVRAARLLRRPRRAGMSSVSPS